MLKLRNFGQKSYQEIENRLTSIGLSLNPKVEQDEEEAEDTETAETGAEGEEPDAGETGTPDEEEPQHGEPQI